MSEIYLSHLSLLNYSVVYLLINDVRDVFDLSLNGVASLTILSIHQNALTF